MQSFPVLCWLYSTTCVYRIGSTIPLAAAKNDFARSSHRSSRSWCLPFPAHWRPEYMPSFTVPIQVGEVHLLLANTVGACSPGPATGFSYP
ncbi:uncharacterized protein K460DRAFT_360897 [Cucurbitaria berberidis CBS 394.84]|uniref:Uncharacterized protein n=1 Tax=Cucurbitaria berberidis CBS 394.84 TaxID=1168544 RepID=A0A9P4GS29_9PLEO|nr:uncharacterized protein K460DRAFT_360897 [Cucurbitaria berberidis CBS 394.84]KAF1850031.1 hypothetical protein K460DRAFT_360897 [Cucurbitaria berberidis CBS 394.84]